MTEFDRLFEAFAWREIPGCPGRYVLRGGPTETDIPGLLGKGLQNETPAGAPAEGAGEGAAERSRSAGVARYRSAAAPDPVEVLRFSDGGGLISFVKAGGRFIHTLNTPEGFRRKLEMLGIE